MPKPNRHSGLPVFIGVDPGDNGGIAVIDGRREPALHYMPDNESDILRIFLDIRQHCDFHHEAGLKPCLAYIEEVNRGFPGTSKSTLAKLYGSYKGLRMAMLAAGIPFSHVRATDWQQGLGFPPKGKQTYNERKEYLRDRAQKFFPGLAIWDRSKTSQRQVCDALLIALYCQRKYTGYAPGSH